MRASIGAIGLLSLLSACCGDKQYVNVIDTNAVSAVQHEIKRQLGLYAAAAAMDPTIRDKNGNIIDLAQKRPSDFACGRGNINFDILSVKIDLTTSLDETGSAKIVVAAPFSLGTLGPTFNGSKEALNTQELVYNLWPALYNSTSSAVLNQKIPNDLAQEAPIAAALLSLRNGLIASALQQDPITGKEFGPQPCFVDFNTDAKKPGGDPGDSFKLGLTVTGDLSAGFEIKLTAIDLSATGDRKSISGNTITVNFYQRGTYDIPVPPVPAAPVAPAKPGAKPVKTASPTPVTSPTSPEEVCAIYGATSWQCNFAVTGKGAGLMMKRSTLAPTLMP